MINEGNQIIAVCSDITHIKDAEKKQIKMKSLYFSSVAHELRTPLNSIIPIIRMMLETMKDELNARAINYLTIILNSALHLECVIEDALEVSRIENN